MLRTAVARALSVLGLRARRALLSASCALFACSAAASAQAPPSAGPSFSWVRLPGAEGCVAQAELAANVEARIGRPVFVRPASALVLIEGRIAPGTNGGFEAVIAISDRDGRLYGERPLALAGTDCRALDDVVALVIAVTLRGSAQGIPLPPEISAQLEALFGDEPSTLDPSTLPKGPDPVSAPAEPARDQPVPVPAQTEESRAPSVLRFGLDASIAVASGLQPSGTLAPGARLFASYRDVATLALSGASAIAQEHDVEDTSSRPPMRGTLELRLWYVALAACAQPGAVLGGTLELCARFGLGELDAQASDFEKNDRSTQRCSELGPELDWRAPLTGPLYARLGLGIPIRLSRPKFSYRQTNGTLDTAFQTDRVGVYGELAFGISLP